VACDSRSKSVDHATAEQRERGAGAFELHIDVAPADDAGFRSLRRALRLPLSDVPWLKERVPGVVRRGARVDLLAVLDRVRDSGHHATLRRRAASEPEP
jgi:hypothetical protein